MSKKKWILFLIISACTPNKTVTISEQKVDSTLKSIYANYSVKNPKWKTQMAEVKTKLAKVKNPQLHSLYYTTLGLFVLNEGNIDSAVALQLKALGYSKKTGNDTSAFNQYLNLAEIYNTTKELDKSYEMLLKCAPVINKVNSEKKIYYYTQYGKYWAGKQELSKAKSHFFKAYALSLNKPDKIGSCLENLASIYNAQNMLDSAKHYYAKAENEYIQNKDSASLAHLYFNMSELFWDNIPKNTLLNFLEKGIKLCQSNCTPQLQLSYLYNLAFYYSENNNITLANKYLWEHQILTDSIYSMELISNLAKMEKQFSIKEKEFENKQLTTELKQKKYAQYGAISIALLTLALGFIQYKTHKRKKQILEQEKELANKKIEHLLQEKEIKNMNTLLEGREEERQRIGRDLHDRLGSILSTVKLHFSTMEDKIELLKTENKQQYQIATSLLDEAVTEVRKISHDLVSGTLVNMGLNEALKELTENLKMSNKINTHFYSNKKTVNLPIITEIALYRIAQELISNALKHAKASELTINLTYTPEQVTLMLEDNGCGFDKTLTSHGIGLKNIQTRTAELNGVVSLDSQPNKGTTAIVEIPIIQAKI